MNNNKKNLASKELRWNNNVQIEKLNRKKNKKTTREMHLNWIRRKVILGTGYTIPELKLMYTEENLFFIALKHITTTKKSLCKALEIGVDNCCRYKRDLKKKGLLIESVENYTCRFSGMPAKLITTNPSKFDDLLRTNQLEIIFDYD